MIGRSSTTRAHGPSTLARLRTAPARLLVFAIGVYRTMISPLRPPSCRFMPTCSEYALDALREYGALRGGWLSARRLARCGPWHPGGWDPIPERQCRTPTADDGVHHDDAHQGA